jgi:hypothetical protein
MVNRAVSPQRPHIQRNTVYSDIPPHIIPAH